MASCGKQGGTSAIGAPGDMAMEMVQAPQHTSNQCRAANRKMSQSCTTKREEKVAPQGTIILVPH